MQSLFCLIGVADISITNNRQFRPAFDFGNEIPVRLALITLGSGPSMNSHPLATRLVSRLNTFMNGQFIFVPTCSHLDGERQANPFFNSGKECFHISRVTHQCRSASFFHHFFYRATHIDIYKISSRLFHHAHRLDNVFGRLAKKLNSNNRSGTFMNAHHFPGLLGIIKKSFRRY